LRSTVFKTAAFSHSAIPPGKTVSLLTPSTYGVNKFKPQCCIKKMKKISQIAMGVEKSRIRAIFPECTNGAIQGRFDISPSFLPFGKAGGLQIRRCQGLAVAHYGFAPGALALKPSGFCNIGVYEWQKRRGYDLGVDIRRYW